jgi:hypothetical protein
MVIGYQGSGFRFVTVMEGGCPRPPVYQYSDAGTRESVSACRRIIVMSTSGIHRILVLVLVLELVH